MRAIRSICVLLSLVLVTLAIPASSPARVGISITIAPPVLPVYVQPICPGDGYVWTPGYWAYGDDGYYWVPGTWVLAPEVGFLWTPGYWGWGGGVYIWHAGYWGPRVGFYGGINYGFGYTGFGYAGGYWSGGHFFYNRSVNNVNVTVIHNTYNKSVVTNNAVGRVSFNGGHGGTTARPTAVEEAAARDHHISATSLQEQHQREASTNRSQFASVNHGKPAIAATAKPAEFSGHGLVAAKAAGGRYEPVANRTSSRAPSSSPSREVRPAETKPAPRENRSAPRENKPAVRENKPAPERSTPTRAETRPSTSSHIAAPRDETRPETKPTTKPERVAPSRTESRTESKPAVRESKPAPTPHATAPRTESKPTPTPHATAPRPQHAAPAQHQAAPRPQSKPEEHPKSEHPQ